MATADGTGFNRSRAGYKLTSWSLLELEVRLLEVQELAQGAVQFAPCLVELGLCRVELTPRIFEPEPRLVDVLAQLEGFLAQKGHHRLRHLWSDLWRNDRLPCRCWQGRGGPCGQVDLWTG